MRNRWRKRLNARQCSKLSRAGPLDRIFGHTLAFLVWIGLIRSHFCVLEVRGRKTGKPISLPVHPLDLDGRRYLVCARGNSNWVRNARAAGEVVLARAMRRHGYAVRELPSGERPAVLKSYLDRFAGEVQRFFPVPKGSPAEAFKDLAPGCPVFRAGALGQDGPRFRKGFEAGQECLGWKNVVRPSRPRFARHLRMSHFLQYHQRYTVMLRGMPCGGIIADPEAAGRLGQDGSAGCGQSGEAAPGRRVDGGVGSRSRA